MIRVWIDGEHFTGWYRAECRCGAIWEGEGEALGASAFSPALPIASAIAHQKLEHDDVLLDVSWTERFSSWLLNYWQREKLRQARAGREPIGDTSGVARPAPRTAHTSARGSSIVAPPLDTEAESRVGPSVSLGREA
jgi:hypothetical protein